MNDPGLDDVIDESAKRVEREIQEEEQVEANDEQTFLNPRYASPQQYPYAIDALGIILIELDSRWWFASTAFPLLAVGNCTFNLIQHQPQNHTHPWYRGLLGPWPARSRCVP